MVDRIASFAHTSRLVENNLRIQKEYANKQIQNSTGLKSDTYDGIASDTNRILNLESEYSQLISFAENGQAALDRTQVAFDALGGVIDVGQSFLSNLTSAISGITLKPDEIQSFAESAQNQIVASLNTQVAGRYIFSGSATNTAPVDVSGYGGAVIPSTADTSYYQGNDYIQSVEVAEGYSVEYGVTADDPSIEEIMRALDLVQTTPGDPDTLQEALALLNSGLDGLAETKAQVAQDSNAIDNKINENLEEVNLIDNIISDLKSVDMAEVAVKLAELETQLEASYSATTGLLKLNITDFL